VVLQNVLFTDRFLVDGGQKREMPTTELYFDNCCRSTTAASTSRDGDPERIQYNDADDLFGQYRHRVAAVGPRLCGRSTSSIVYGDARSTFYLPVTPPLVQ
jgi:hypothetical protein